ncbi:putative cold-shock DNA-binding protein [Dokdonia sp. Hel_I_63]|uniref:cold-shock protein n=1 Tax=Dokdonia sp. Hel_I_63 TaxID=1249996 RepID=UPI001199AE9E|nr:cold shock domain-containing protein [Dokdonia sp. Hel_I_63]TVZ23051.1 putative cold-shock DNA-binding protein [Dokdonia sp. Hel_I_63]
MARPQETFGKKEREKKRLKKAEDKRKKKAARKESGEKANEFVYVNHLGQLVDTPPDPALKEEVDVDDIVLGIPKKVEGDEPDPIRTGFVEFFDSSKGFGFIKDADTPEKYFVHISEVRDGELKEGNKVSYEIERGQKGMNAVRVSKVA